jgi:acetyl-CoA carboxylase alpha subunit
MHLTAHDALEISAIDEVLGEPPDGAHADPAQAARVVAGFLMRELERLMPMGPELLMRERQQRFRDFLRFDREPGHQADILDFRFATQEECGRPMLEAGI